MVIILSDVLKWLVYNLRPRISYNSTVTGNLSLLWIIIPNLFIIRKLSFPKLGSTLISIGFVGSKSSTTSSKQCSRAVFLAIALFDFYLSVKDGSIRAFLAWSTSPITVPNMEVILSFFLSVFVTCASEIEFTVRQLNDLMKVIGSKLWPKDELKHWRFSITISKLCFGRLFGTNHFMKPSLLRAFCDPFW